MLDVAARDAVRRLEVAAMFAELSGGHGALEQAYWDRRHELLARRRERQRAHRAALKTFDRAGYQRLLATERAAWRRNYVPKTDKRWLTKEQRSELVELYRSGLSMGACGKRFGMTRQGVRNALRSAGIEIEQRRPPSGMHHRLAKLTPERVAYVLASPLGARALGREMGVHHKTIIAIRQRRTWREVAGAR